MNPQTYPHPTFSKKSVSEYPCFLDHGLPNFFTWWYMRSLEVYDLDIWLIYMFSCLFFHAYWSIWFLVPWTDLDIRNIMEEATSRWLRPNEIHAILSNYKHFSINVKPVNLPKSNLWSFKERILFFFFFF